MSKKSQVKKNLKLKSHGSNSNQRKFDRDFEGDYRILCVGAQSIPGLLKTQSTVVYNDQSPVGSPVVELSKNDDSHQSMGPSSRKRGDSGNSQQSMGPSFRKTGTPSFLLPSAGKTVVNLEIQNTASHLFKRELSVDDVLCLLELVTAGDPEDNEYSSVSPADLGETDDDLEKHSSDRLVTGAQAGASSSALSSGSGEKRNSTSLPLPTAPRRLTITHTLTNEVIQESRGFILMYDPGRPESLDLLPRLREQILRALGDTRDPPNTPLVIAGNGNSDSSSAVTQSQLQDLSERFGGVPFFSSLEDEECLKALVRLIREKEERDARCCPCDSCTVL